MQDPEAKPASTKPSEQAFPPRQRGPVTLAELSAGLVWPLLLRAPALAIQPPRLLLALFTIAAMALAVWLFDASLHLLGAQPLAAPMFDEMGAALGAFADRAIELRLTAAATELIIGIIGAPLRAMTQRPLAASALALLIAPVWMVGGGALCRMVAVDVAGRLNLSIADALASSFRRAASLAGAALIPLFLIAALALAIKLAGWALLSLAVVDLLGGALFGLALLAGFALATLFVGYAAGHALLAPAVVVEGGDAMDAVQRAYAYVIGRPGRAALYAAAALAQGALAYILARAFVAATISSTTALATAWLSHDRAKSLLTLHDHQPLAGWLIAQWNHLAWMFLAAFAVSLYFSASTLVYLLLRRVNDEQDIHDVWMDDRDAEPRRTQPLTH